MSRYATTSITQTNDKVRRHFELCKKLNETYERKNHDYGDSFHKSYLEEGLAMARIRLGDKYNRFCALSRKGAERKVDDESIIDTLLDMANYAIMTVMELSERSEDGVERSGTMGEPLNLHSRFHANLEPYDLNAWDTGAERGCCDIPPLTHPISPSDASTRPSETSGVSAQWLKRVSPEELLEGYRQGLMDGKAERRCCDRRELDEDGANAGLKLDLEPIDPHDPSAWSYPHDEVRTVSVFGSGSPQDSAQGLSGEGGDSIGRYKKISLDDIVEAYRRALDEANERTMSALDRVIAAGKESFGAFKAEIAEEEDDVGFMEDPN